MIETYAFFAALLFGLGLALTTSLINARTIALGFALMFGVILDYGWRLGPWHDAIQREAEQQEALQKGWQWKDAP